MYTLKEYIHFRKDILIKNKSYNDLDIAVLTAISYIRLENLNHSLPITLEKVYLYLKDQLDFQNELYGHFKYYYEIFIEVCLSDRFKKIQIIDYQSKIDKDLTLQFSSTSFLLEDGTIVIAFRGTDESLIGWHEDFKLFYHDEVEADRLACIYLSEKLNQSYPIGLKEMLNDENYGSNKFYRFKKYQEMKQNRKYIITGHSKGGHLALYSAFTNLENQNKIKAIYNFDGPGLTQTLDLDTIDPYFLKKIKTYQPEYSFFGRFFLQVGKSEVVKSYNIGLAQHSLPSWQVDIDHFELGQPSEEVQEFLLRFNRYLETMDKQEKEFCFETLFQILDDLAFTKSSDISETNLKLFIRSIEHLSKVDSKIRSQIIELFKLGLGEMKKSKDLLQDKED